MSSYAIYERYYTGGQSPRRKRSGGSAGAGKGAKQVNLNRIFSVLILFLVLVLIGELVFHLVISPRLLVRSVSVTSEGTVPFSQQELLRLAGLEGSVSFLGLRESTIEQRLTASPLIRSARVTKQFPDRLAIAVVPRTALASVLAADENGSRALCVDSEGYILPGSSAGKSSMPVVSGVRLMDVRPGMRFPDELVAYLEQLEQVRREAPELYNLISEIKFVKKSTARYEVVLFPGHARLRVRTGPELNVELLRSILLVIDVVKAQGLLDDLAELDFRTGEVVYRTRGG